MQSDDGRVVSNFIVQALRGEELTVYGDGSQTRSFCYVDDLVDGLIRLMDNDGLHRPGEPRQPGRVHDPGAGGTSARPDRRELRDRPQAAPADDPRQRSPDIALARGNSAGSRRRSSPRV